MAQRKGKCSVKADHQVFLKLLHDRGHSLRWLALRMGYSEAALSRFANGHYEPSMKFMQQMSDAMKLTRDEQTAIFHFVPSEIPRFE